MNSKPEYSAMRNRRTLENDDKKQQAHTIMPHLIDQYNLEGDGKETVKNSTADACIPDALRPLASTCILRQLHEPPRTN